MIYTILGSFGSFLNMFWGLIETTLLSTHNICFGWEIRKIIFSYTLLSGGLIEGLLVQATWEPVSCVLEQDFLFSA